MRPANETQVGGDHYRADYQHWDWVSEYRIPYVLGCATKYLCRARRRGHAAEDYRKAAHYYRKAAELVAAGVLPAQGTGARIARLAAAYALSPAERSVLRGTAHYCCSADLRVTAATVEALAT